MMSLEENKQVVADFFQALRTGNLEAIDKITTDDFMFRANNGEGGIDKKTFLPLIKGTIEAMPDHTSWIDDIVAEGDKVAVRMTATGTQTGEWMGFAPTNKFYSITEFFILRVEDGKIAEYWGVKDGLGQFQQLGIIPSLEAFGQKPFGKRD